MCPSVSATTPRAEMVTEAPAARLIGQRLVIPQISMSLEEEGGWRIIRNCYCCSFNINLCLFFSHVKALKKSRHFVVDNHVGLMMLNNFG